MNKWILDGIANYIFWSPTVVVFIGIPSGWTIEQTITYLLISIPMGIIGGVLFGRFLNRWRKRLGYE